MSAQSGNRFGQRAVVDDFAEVPLGFKHVRSSPSLNTILMPCRSFTRRATAVTEGIGWCTSFKPVPMGPRNLVGGFLAGS